MGGVGRRLSRRGACHQVGAWVGLMLHCGWMAVSRACRVSAVVTAAAVAVQLCTGSPCTRLQRALLPHRLPTCPPARACPAHPSGRLHEFVRHGCSYCRALSKLSQFYESKTRTRPTKKGSGR